MTLQQHAMACHATLSSPGFQEELGDRVACLPGRPGRPGWPAHHPSVLLWSAPLPFRSRRQLYEAALGVERGGGTVVERRLSLVDAVLSPSAGLVICDNGRSKLVSH